MGRTEDGGLGWPPSEFWASNVYDIERALALAKRRSKAMTKDEAFEIRERMRDVAIRDAEERAALGETRPAAEILRELTAKLLNFKQQ